MKNNITILSETEQSIVVNLNGMVEHYCLKVLPTNNSTIVYQAKQELLQSFDLAQLTFYMNTAANLFYLISDTSAGTELQSKLTGLHKALLDCMDESIISVQFCRAKAEQLTILVGTIYKYLTNCQEELAIAQLLRSSAAFQSMIEKIGNLSANLSRLLKRAESILNEILGERNLPNEITVQIRETIARLNAQLLSRFQQQEELQFMIENYDTAYTEEVISLLPNISVDIHDRSEALKKQQMAILQRKLELKKQNREQLIYFEMFAQNITWLEAKKEPILFIAEGLQAAMQSLQFACATLQAGSSYFHLLEKRCANLERKRQSEPIVQLLHLEQEKRLKIYHNPDFMYAILNCTSKWVALQQICYEYLNTAQQIRGTIITNFQQESSMDNVQHALPAIANDMRQQVQQQMEQIVKQCELLESNLLM